MRRHKELFAYQSVRVSPIYDGSHLSDMSDMTGRPLSSHLRNRGKCYATIRGIHVMIDELQAALVFNTDNQTRIGASCKIRHGYHMENGIITEIHINIKRITTDKIQAGHQS